MEDKELLISLLLVWIVSGLWAGWRTWQVAKQDGTRTETTFWIAVAVTCLGPIAAVCTYAFDRQDAKNERRHS